MTSLFPDKRDKNYYKIDVEDHLFEVFKHKLRKCKKINIPPTVSITNGKINNWFFNSKVENNNPILMKNNDKLNTYEILKGFANLKNVSDRPTIEMLMEGFRKDIFFHKNCAFVRFTNGEKLIATGRDLAVLLIERLSSIKSIQGIVDTQSRHGASLNCLVCEYRSDRNDCPPNFSFLIKATTTNAQEVLKENPDAFSAMNINRVNQEYLYKVHQEDIEGDIRGFFQDLYGDETDVHVKIRNEAMKSYINLNCKRTYLKSMDTRSNEEASKIAKELALYIEGSHKIKVKKLVCTFLNDQFHNVYLMGIKELLFDFSYSGTYDARSVAESYSKESSIHFEDLVATIQANEYEKRVKGSTIQMEQDKKLSEVKSQILGLRQLKEVHHKNGDQENIGSKSSRDNNRGARGSEMIQTFVIPEGPKHKQPISHKLMSKLKINQCQGDFCEFYTVTNAQIFVEDFRDIQIESELRKQKEDPDNFKDLVKKPFQILNSLRLKCRENLEETVFLIKKHQIVPRIDNTLIFSDDKDIDTQIMSLLQVKAYRKDVENIDNLYRTLRVCKLCYTVYSIMSKHFEKTQSLMTTDRGSTNFTLTKTDQSTHRSILKDSAINNMSHNELPKIHFKRSSMDEAVNETMGSKRHSRRLTSQRIPTLEKDESGLQLALKTTVSQARGSLSVRDTDNLAMKKTQGKPGPNKVKNKKSNSTLANTRLLHGILQKVSNPAIEETEKKLMVEREIMKQKTIKREAPTYVHNLLELVTDQDDKVTEESSKLLNTEEYEKKAKTASFAFKESLKEIDRETGLRLVRTKEDHFSLSFKSKRQNQINNTDLRRRIVQKVNQYSNQPSTQNNMLGKPKYESIYHKNTTTMKALSEYRLPMARPQTCYKKLLHYTPQSIKFSNYCDIKNMEVPYFAQNLPVEQLIIDAQTAIPFLVLSNTVESDANKNGSNVLVVVHDMFDSFFETVQFYEEVLSMLPNTKIILFNYPGQAFTAYDSSVLQTNEDISTMLDILLNLLLDSNRMTELDKIFLLGIGYGGNIASCFLSYNNNINTNIHSAFVVNSFLRVDQEINNTAQEWIQVLQTLPAELPEIHINHYYVMALSQEGTHILQDAVFMREKVEKNPIKIEGKIYILKGLMSGLDLTDTFSKLDLNIYVVHSLNNCIFRSNNADLFMKISTQDKGMKKRIKNEKKGERKVLYYEGGHDISTESPEVLRKMILDFVTTNSVPQYKAFSLLKSQELV